MLAVHTGMVRKGYRIASGGSVGEKKNPFSAGSLALQAPFFKAHGFDFLEHVPDMVWGTINLQMDGELLLNRADITLPPTDWTVDQDDDGRIPPEVFSFVRCSLYFGERFYSGLLYYPHPETKPGTNAHHYDRLEVLTRRVPDMAYDRPAAVVCRADAFRAR